MSSKLVADRKFLYSLIHDVILGSFSFSPSCQICYKFNTKEPVERFEKGQILKISKIISGGQTGVDRAALDAAISLGLEHGGFCPKGGVAEDGIIPVEYKMDELDTEEYSVRTMKNVQCSDVTLILHHGEITSGTALTEEFCKLKKKPWLIINILDEFKEIRVNLNRWLETNNITILNIAGPRESEGQIYKKAKDLLIRLLKDHVCDTNP